MEIEYTAYPADHTAHAGATRLCCQVAPIDGGWWRAASAVAWTTPHARCQVRSTTTPRPWRPRGVKSLTIYRMAISTLASSHIQYTHILYLLVCHYATVDDSTLSDVSHGGGA